MPTLISSPRIQLVDADGNPYVGAKLYTCATLTNAPVATYSDSGLSVANTNPLISDANGFFPVIYPNPALGALKFRFFDANDVNLGLDTDPAYLPDDPLTAADIGAALYDITEDETNASVTPTNYRYPPFDARRYGWTSGNTATQNATAITNAIAVAAAASGATVTLPPGSFNCNAFTIPQFVLVRGAGGRATRLTNNESGYFVRIGGAKSGVLKYKCGITDVWIELLHKDGHAVNLMETCGAEVKRIYSEGTLTASRSNIFINIDGGDISTFFNHIEDCIANHFETGYRIVTSGTTSATHQQFTNCTALGDVGSFATSIGLRVATGEGSGSIWEGGNLEACGRGMKFENGCKSMSVVGARFEGNTKDLEAEATAGYIAVEGGFFDEVNGIVDTGERIIVTGTVNGSNVANVSRFQAPIVVRARANGQIPITAKGFAGYTTDKMLAVQDSTGTDKFVVRHDGTMQLVAGISATSTASKNLRGSATFSAGTTVAVTFASAEPDASYYVELTAQADPVGRLWVSSKGTGGFTINNSSSTSITVDWVLIR